MPFVWVFAICGTFRSVIADWNVVPTGSMEPTILVGDRIWVNKMAYGFRVPLLDVWVSRWDSPKRGEIVTLYPPAGSTGGVSVERMVKRVIGEPGDVIELRDNLLFINGAPARQTALDLDTIRTIEDSRRGLFQFATESLNGHEHPVMFMPSARSPRSFGPMTIPASQYLMMGDSRDRSADSRFFGLVDESSIHGRCSMVLFSLDQEGFLLPRWSRFLHSVR